DAAPAFADIDNDGDFDLAVGDSGGDVEFFRNDTPYLTSGTFISSAIDTGQHSDFTTLDFTILEPTGADLKFQLRTATTEAGLAIAIWRGPTGTTDFYIISGTAINPVHDGHRWIQYKAFFSTTITSVSPTLADITINYQFFPASASLTSSPFNTTNPRNALTQILWTETLPTGTEIRFQVRTAPDLAGVPGTWTVWAGPCDGIAGSFAATFFTDPTGAEPIDADMRDGINDQWMQYKVWLETTDIMVTPILFDVTTRTELVTHIVFPPGKLVIVAPHPVTADGAVFWLRLPVETIEATLKIFAIDGRLLVSTPLDPLADRYPAVGRWRLKDEHGRRLGSGIYFYLVKIKDSAGRIILSPVQKMVIDR
ncbi:hypothetical protein LM597_01570, partial [Candidatus Acetothermia bacterium]|nr:hypothetical protein [Candidatus Acetothermia bacterium]